jgi:hypothetical protein
MSGSNTLSTETDEVIVDKFKPSGRFMAAFTSLAIVNLACALDATDIGVALPVSTFYVFFHPCTSKRSYLTSVDRL